MLILFVMEQLVQGCDKATFLVYKKANCQCKERFFPCCNSRCTFRTGILGVGSVKTRFFPEYSYSFLQTIYLYIFEHKSGCCLLLVLDLNSINLFSFCHSQAHHSLHYQINIKIYLQLYPHLRVLSWRLYPQGQWSHLSDVCKTSKLTCCQAILYLYIYMFNTIGDVIRAA